MALLRNILLLIVALILLPQTTAAAIFINQTSSIAFTSAYTTIGQSFTVPSYANSSTYSLDYIEVRGQRVAVGTQNVNMSVSNLTYSSDNVTVAFSNTLKLYRFNYSNVLLNSGLTYTFTLTCDGCGNIAIFYANTNPYSGGVMYIDGVAQPADDMVFNISLSPHDNVGNWTFNQASGNYANDSTPFFNNGTLAGVSKPTWTTNLVNGSVNSTALQFGGRGNVNITTNESLNFTTGMSFFGWIKPADFTAYDPIMIIANDDINTKRAWALRLNGGTGVLKPIVWDSSGVSHTTTTGYNMPLNTWQFVGFTVNGLLNLSVDGTIIDSVTFPTDMKITDTNISIGSPSNNFFDQFYYNGTVDEFKMYNYVLNQSEITALYQRFQPVPAYPVGGLIISPTSASTTIDFVWHDTVYPQDEIIIATDSGFTNVVHDAFHSTDTASVSLTVGTTYYWKVRQFDSGTGSYGNTSATQTFTIGTTPTFIRVNVFDELNLTPLVNINATLTSIATNTSVNLSTAGSFVNFTNPSITDGVEYLAQVGAIGYTTRNILITSPGNYSIYLPYTATPTGVSQINFVESDYTGMFPYQSTKLIVQKVINTTLVNISSNYFDATGLSTAQLINGQLYQLVVESTVSTRVLGSYIPTASATQTLLIGTFTLQPSSAFNGLVYNFTYNSNQSIVLQWNDPNEEIISLNETITNQLNAIVLQLITSVHSGQTTYLIANTSSKYLVQLNISTVHYGYIIYSNWYNPALFTSANASLAPTPGPNNYVIPFGNTTAIGNQSNANAPIPQWVKNFFSVSVLVIMALLFNREHVLRGAVVVSLFSLVFWLTGMLVFDVGYITTGAILGMGFVISVIALLAESNRG